MKSPKWIAVCFAIAFLISLIFSMLVGDSAMDIHLHDTYLVIANQHLLWLISCIFLVLGIIYYTLNKLFPITILSIIHLVFTIQIFVVMFLEFSFTTNEMPLGYTDFSSTESMWEFLSIHKIIGGSAILFLFAQLLFLNHLFFGVIKSNR